jgi:CheY-like chemotaxis protein
VTCPDDHQLFLSLRASLEPMCPPPAAAAAVSCRTLIVEDDLAGCEVLMRVLKHLGHNAECARTVHQALRQFERFKPTHVLLDLMLPDGNGAEVLAMIRERNLPVKVAVITAVGPGRYLDEALAHDPDAVFKKPWDLSDLKGFLTQEQDD